MVSFVAVQAVVFRGVPLSLGIGLLKVFCHSLLFLDEKKQKSRPMASTTRYRLGAGTT